MRVADCSFTSFVLPFLYNPAHFEARVERVEQALAAGNRGSLVWEAAHLPHADVLRHVAEFINSPRGAAPTARAWDMTAAALALPDRIGTASTWTLIRQTSHVQSVVPFRFKRVRLVLFRAGVGLLTIEASPLSSEMEHWLDFLSYFRFFAGDRGISIQPGCHGGQPEAACDDLAIAERTRLLDELIRWSLETASIPEDPITSCVEEPDRVQRGPWWEEVFMPGRLIPFAAVYLDGVPEADVPAIRYRFRSFFHTGQGGEPGGEERVESDGRSLMQYAGKLWFTFSLEGVTFQAFDAPDNHFYRVDLPNHLRDQYFLVFLLVLQQRFALMRISQEVARCWHDEQKQGAGSGRADAAGMADEARAQTFARLQDAFLAYTARSHFTQVMQHDNHHRFYRQWQEVLQVDRLYQEVRDEVQEMHSFVHTQLAQEQRRAAEAQERAQQEETRQATNLQVMLARIAFLIGLPTLALQFLSTVGVRSWRAATLWTAGAFVVAAVASALAGRMIRGRRAAAPGAAPARRGSLPGGGQKAGLAGREHVDGP